MPYIFLYLLLPLTAILIDLLLSFISLPRISIFGKLADRSNADGESEYLFALQSDEPKPREFVQEPLALVFSLKSAYRFSQHRPIEITHGPGDEYAVEWGEPSRNSIIVRVPRLRPLKTWTFRCRVERAAPRLRMELRVPTHMLFKKWLLSINAHTFKFANVGYLSTSIEVADRPLRKDTTASWIRAWKGLLPMLTLGVILYAWLWVDLLSPMHTAYQEVLPKGPSTWFLESRAVMVDMLLYALGILAIYSMTRVHPNPIAQGYQASKTPEINSRHSLGEMDHESRM